MRTVTKISNHINNFQTIYVFSKGQIQELNPQLVIKQRINQYLR